MQGRGLSPLQLEQGRREEGLSGEGSGRRLMKSSYSDKKEKWPATLLRALE